MGFTLLPWLAPQICRILGFCKGLFKGLEGDTVNWQTLVNMQAAIKVGLYPSNDVISWTDSLGVAFQATPGLVSCTPTEGQSHLRVFFFQILRAFSVACGQLSHSSCSTLCWNSN